MTIKKLAAGTHARFIDYYKDADNWSGTPLVGGNVGGDSSDIGFLLNMKKANLIETFTDRGDVFLDFTEVGHAYFSEHG